MKDNTVIVLDLSNYKLNFREKVPFKAVVTEKYDDEITVESLETNREYMLYPHQILETLSSEEVEKLINLDNYGK